MFDNLQALGYGVVGFAIILGVGTIVLQKFGDSVASCATDYTYSSTTQVCTNASGGDPTAPVNTPWVNVNYLNGQLGTSGLAGWTPAIIAFTVGMLFLGAFLIGKGKSRSY